MVESVVTPTQNDLSAAEMSAVYRTLRERRDVRAGYLSQPIDDTKLYRLLSAAHQAPSVGCMQPWRFIVVCSEAPRTAVHGVFKRANSDAAARYGGGPDGPCSDTLDLLRGS